MFSLTIDIGIPFFFLKKLAQTMARNTVKLGFPEFIANKVVFMVIRKLLGTVVREML